MGELPVSTHYTGLGSGLSRKYTCNPATNQWARDSLQADELNARMFEGFTHHRGNRRDGLFVWFNDVSNQDRPNRLSLRLRRVQRSSHATAHKLRSFSVSFILLRRHG